MNKFKQKKGMPDFKELTAQISFADILEHYNLTETMTVHGNQLRGACPIHDGGNKTSFSINPERRIFKCFSCQAKGNILNFIMAMEDCTIYKAGCLLQDWFKILKNKKSNKSGSKASNGSAKGREKIVQEENPSTVAKQKNSGEINPPLSFALNHLNADHEYILKRIKPETAKHFGLGYCSKGLMKDRVAVPIHNQTGELVAYAGRSIDQQEEDEKYKFPPGFKKGCVLFNLHRVVEEIKQGKPLILVEGFFDVFRLYELGYSTAVALMGSVLTDGQVALLKAHLNANSKIALMFDNDKAGLKCRSMAIDALIEYFFIKTINLPVGKTQPDQLQEEDITELKIKS